MDGQRFDRLTRQWHRVLTRRRFSGALAAAGLGSALSIGAPPESEAKKKGRGKNRKKKCKKNKIKCGKKCVNPQSNALHCGGCGRRCGSNIACVNGSCQGGCPANQILCGELCVDPSDNDDHCGSCGNACTDDLTCDGGRCRCPEGETLCGSECVDTLTDDDHCGACDDPCPDGEHCQDGQCVAGVVCHPNCHSSQICPDEPCPCSQHCGFGWCGDCCADGDCIGNPNGNQCIPTRGGGNTACGCEPMPGRNVRPCGPNGECSDCCSDEECVLRVGPGGRCNYPTFTTGSCECYRELGFEQCNDGLCHFVATDPMHCGRCDNKCCSSPESCVASNIVCLDGRCCGAEDFLCTRHEDCCNGSCQFRNGALRCTAL